MIPSLRICSTGSIAIIAIPNLILTLRIAYSTEINCFLTDSARHFVGEHTFAAVSGRIVHSEECAVRSEDTMSTPLLIAPASANAIAAMAMGNTAHLAARLATSSTGPVFVCPAMNQIMWDSPRTVRAITTLREFGYIIIGPSQGIEIETLARSRSSLAPIDTIVSELIAHLPWQPTERA